jgi:invasion protein IalB
MYNVDGTPVAEFNLNVIESNGTVVAGANVITPLETLLTAQLIIRIDEKNAKAYPFVFCLKMGCVARIGLTTNDMDSYHTGNQATVTLVPAGASGQQENLLLSLAGFTAGHKALIGN